MFVETDREAKLKVGCIVCVDFVFRSACLEILGGEMWV